MEYYIAVFHDEEADGPYGTDEVEVLSRLNISICNIKL